ncbi:MAG TPA: WYL domain-containing protein [Gammaproteobacteria bacterium]|nr:WYL domain-containing protein [Gammaproteobacteria bacterium]
MNKLIGDIKWGTRQRLQYIEVMAYYTGVVTRSDVARAFGISDAAATKDLKLYGQLSGDSLHYRHNVFGFVPSEGFQPLFADLSPARVLPMIAANLAATSGPYGNRPIFGIAADSLPLPQRLPDHRVLAQTLRAIKQRNKLQVSYHSLSDRDSSQQRLLEPHTLVNTGTRWHLRAYNEETYDFRDFVLSRLADAKMLSEPAESSAQYDEDWIGIVTLQLTPHPGLNARQQASVLMDYQNQNRRIEMPVRRALAGYLLHRLSVDTTTDHSMNPNTHQLILLNRDEIEAFADWAFFKP